jgi:hypothetical protein
MRVLLFCIFFPYACGKHVSTDWDLDVDNIKLNRTESGDYCPKVGGISNEHGLLNLVFFMRAPTGWLWNYDFVANGLHDVLKGVLAAFHVGAVPKMHVEPKVFTCEEDGARTHIFSYRICGILDPERFCQCTLKMNGVKSWACKKSIGLLNSDMLPVDKMSLYKIIDDNIMPKVEREIARAAIKNGLFTSDDGIHIIALKVVERTGQNNPLDKWKNQKDACFWASNGGPDTKVFDNGRYMVRPHYRPETEGEVGGVIGSNRKVPEEQFTRKQWEWKKTREEVLAEIAFDKEEEKKLQQAAQEARRERGIIGMISDAAQAEEQRIQKENEVEAWSRTDEAKAWIKSEAKREEERLAKEKKDLPEICQDAEELNVMEVARDLLSSVFTSQFNRGADKGSA